MRHSSLPGGIALAAAIALAMGRICVHDFAGWDDDLTLYRNPRLNPPTVANVFAYWREWRDAELDIYIPVTQTVWAALARIGYVTVPDERGIHLNPYVFHTASLLVHICAAWAVFALRRVVGGGFRVRGSGFSGRGEARMTKPEMRINDESRSSKGGGGHGGTEAMGNDEVRSPKPQRMTNGEIRRHTGNWQPATGNSSTIENRKSKIENVSAFAGALFFALHPVQVEVVAWASGMKDLLGGLFAVLALWQYVRHLRTPLAATGRWPLTPNFAAATAFLILAILSKPTAVVVPLMAIVMDRLLIGRAWRAVLLTVMPWLLLAVLGAVVARLNQPAAHVPQVSAPWRPLIAADAIVFYLRRLVVPIGLAPDYGRTPQVALTSVWPWLGVPILGAIGCLIWRLRKAGPWPAAALLALSGLLPVLGLVPFDFQGYSTVSDRYLYFAMPGVALAVAALLERARPAVAVAATVAIFLVAGTLSFLQAGRWRDDRHLYGHTLRVNPDSWVALNTMGALLGTEGQEDLAAEYFRRAIRIQPRYVRARENLVRYLLARQEHWQAIDQMRQLLAVLREDSSEPTAHATRRAYIHLHLARTLVAVGRPGEARAELEAALALAPRLTTEAADLARQIDEHAPPPTSAPAGPAPVEPELR